MNMTMTSQKVRGFLRTTVQTLVASAITFLTPVLDWVGVSPDADAIRVAAVGAVMGAYWSLMDGVQKHPIVQNTPILKGVVAFFMGGDKAPAYDTEVA